MIWQDPLALIHWWFEYLRCPRREIPLTDEEVFRTPKLYLYEQKVAWLRLRSRHLQTIEAYLAEVENLISNGWKPDLIRAHTVYPAGAVAREIKRKHGVPYLLSEHAPFSVDKFPVELRAQIRAAFREADRVLSLSYDKVRQVCMSGIDIEPHIIFNYVDENLFRGLAPPYTPQSSLKLASIGAASHYKDHATLLRSLVLLKKKKIPFKLSLVGLGAWGSRREETIRLINGLGLENDVELIDSMTRVEVAQFLPRNHVFVLTSIHEGFPNSVLEALASGLFVIATRHGGTEDLLTDDVGRIVPIKAAESVATLLARLYHGEILIDPGEIRRFVIRRCGREAFRKRMLEHCFVAMRGKPDAVSLDNSKHLIRRINEEPLQ